MLPISSRISSTNLAAPLVFGIVIASVCTPAESNLVVSPIAPDVSVYM